MLERMLMNYNRRAITVPSYHTATIIEVILSKSGILFIGCEEGQMFVYNSITMELIEKIGLQKQVSCAILAKNEELLFIGEAGGTVEIYDANNLKKLKVIELQSKVLSLNEVPYGILGATMDGSIYFLDF